MKSKGGKGKGPSPAERKANYKRLRDAGFTRDFARANDKAGADQIDRLVGEVSRFQTDRGRELAGLRIQAQRGNRRAAQRLEQMTPGPAPTYQRATDVPWYRNTSEQLSGALDQLRDAYHEGAMDSAEYAAWKERFAEARRLLREKALHGPEYLKTEDYHFITDLFHELQEADLLDVDTFAELYGSDEDND